MTIPDWDQNGVLPPIRPGTPERAEHLDFVRSPYDASSIDLVDRFAISWERSLILQGFLDYRAALYSAGIVAGFQWVNGSFVEHKEVRSQDDGPPSDIDVVTYFYPPATGNADYVRLFDPAATKQQFNVDAYGVELGRPLVPAIVEDIAYWYGMWSHRRTDKIWKAFLKVPLDPNADAAASQALAIKMQRMGWL